MKQGSNSSRSVDLKRRATLALRAAVRKAYAEHARLGLPVYVWENGKVIARTPAELRKSLRARKKKAPRRARG
jgi:hypothetical protein